MAFGTHQPFSDTSYASSSDIDLTVTVGSDDDYLIVLVTSTGSSNNAGELSAVTLDPGGGDETSGTNPATVAQELRMNAEGWVVNVSSVSANDYTLRLEINGTETINQYYVRVVPAEDVDSIVAGNSANSGGTDDSPTVTVSGIQTDDELIGCVAHIAHTNDFTTDDTSEWANQDMVDGTFNWSASGHSTTSTGTSDTLSGSIAAVGDNGWATAAIAVRFNAGGGGTDSMPSPLGLLSGGVG